MYSYILSDVQLYTVWCTAIYCLMYSYILSDVQLYTVWCTAIYRLMYSYIHLSVVWNKVALHHYFLSTLNCYSVYQICFPRALPLITIYRSAPHTPLTLSLTKRNNFISTLPIHVSEYQNLPCAPKIPSVFCRPLSLVSLCWQQVSHSADTRFNQIRSEKSNKIPLYFKCQRKCSRVGEFRFSFRLTYFIQAVKLRLPTQNLPCPRNIPSVCCRLL